MRAIFFEAELIAGEVINLDESSLHHLNVVRVRQNENILVVNGNGQKALATILELNKKFGSLKINSVELGARSHHLSLAFCVPKKDAAEEIIKLAVELGVSKIYPLTSEFSQFEIEESERLNRIIESALIQSNNLYWPEIHKQQSIELFLTTNKLPVVYFSSIPQKSGTINFNDQEELIILIGPEAGLSNKEEGIIGQLNHKILINLTTPIMRAPTAVAASIGYVLAKLK